jgi:hypothetical protein
MTDERTTPIVEAWLKGTARTPHDPNEGVRHVMARIPQVRQRRRRRWPLSRLQRSQPTTIDDTTRLEPSPVPASNGHTPTVIGRTSSMLSPVKAITAGALVFALGGAFLAAQPFDHQQADPPEAVAPSGPVSVSGTGSPGPCPSVGTVEESDVARSTRGGYCNPRWLMSDERLTGTVTWATNEDRYLDDSGLLVRVLGISVENGDGSWRMQPEVQFGLPASPPEGLPSEFVLVGDGAYEGLHAVLAWDGSTNELSGFILSGGLPPEPGAPTSP